jgi:hypothetical protein
MSNRYLRPSDVRTLEVDRSGQARVLRAHQSMWWKNVTIPLIQPCTESPAEAGLDTIQTMITIATRTPISRCNKVTRLQALPGRHRAGVDAPMFGPRPENASRLVLSLLSPLLPRPSKLIDFRHRCRLTGQARPLRARADQPCVIGVVIRLTGLGGAGSLRRRPRRSARDCCSEEAQRAVVGAAHPLVVQRDAADAAVLGQRSRLGLNLLCREYA